MMSLPNDVQLIVWKYVHQSKMAIIIKHLKYRFNNAESSQKIFEGSFLTFMGLRRTGYSMMICKQIRCIICGSDPITLHYGVAFCKCCKGNGFHFKYKFKVRYTTTYYIDLILLMKYLKRYYNTCECSKCVGCIGTWEKIVYGVASLLR